MSQEPASPHLEINQAWLDRHREPALDPDRPIIDPHHHLWDRTRPRYMLEDLLADLGSGHRVVATVYAECRSMYRQAGPPDERPIGETEFANGVAAMSDSGLYGETRVCSGIVGFVELRRGAAARDLLEAQCRAGNGRFRGVRYLSAWHPDPAIRSTSVSYPADLFTDPRFREGFACLAPLGLSFDAWLYHSQLDELTALARLFPDTTIVLDHAGGPVGIGPYAGRRDAVFAAWRQAILDLSRCRNVRVKLGGLGMRISGFGFHERAEPPTSQDLSEAWRPYVETCIEAFGAERCMFESNFPVDKGSYSYGVLWNAFKRLSAGASATEKSALFHDTAAQTYRLVGWASDVIGNDAVERPAA